MKPCVIILIAFYCLCNRAYGQSSSAAIDSLVKFHVISIKERPIIEQELRHLKDNGRASYRVAILGLLHNIILQKKFHIDPHKTGIFYSYSNEHINKKSQDSINTSLRVLLRKIKRANLLTDRVYTHASKSIDSSRYLVELQMVGSLTEMSSRLEWLAPGRLLPIAQELHKGNIISDSSFLRLKDNIINDKIESAFQLNDYCKYDRIFDMTKYPEDANVWLEQMHRDIASILPGLDFTDFKYEEIPDTSFSIPGVKFKISLTCNGRIYKRLSFPISNFRNPQGKISPKDIFAEDFHRIFNKVLTDQRSPYRLHNVMFTSATNSEDIKSFALIALKDKQGNVFMKNPVMSYMLVSMDGYDPKLTSTRIDSTITGWEKLGLFSHLSSEEVSKGIDNAQATDPFFISSLLSNFPGVIYNLHDTLKNAQQPYTSLLISLAKITKGEFNPTKITESKIGHRIKLQYLFKGKVHSFIFSEGYGWMDAKFPAFLKKLGFENSLAGNFYVLKYDDSLIYLTKQQHDDAVKNDLLEFAS